MKTEKVMKVLKVVGAGVLLLGVGAFAGSQMFPKTIESVEYKTVEVLKEVPVIEFQDKIVEVEKVVEVESGNMDLVLQHIYDNEGNIEYITEDLDDDELDLIVDRVILVNDFKALALDSVKKDLFDELDGEVVNGTTLDDKDMEKLKLDSDSVDGIVEDIDFEDLDAELLVTGSFRQDDDKFDFEARVVFKDNEYDELEIVSVTKQ